MSEDFPLLSICVLTYNRANLLEVMLKGLVSQIKKYESVIELVIADNCSTDNTREVVHQAQKQTPISYYRNDFNIGVVRNILKVFELAKGQFIWGMGDDDMLIEGKLPLIIDVLKDCHRLDYIYVNCTFEFQAFREELILERNSVYDPRGKLCLTTDFGNRLLPKWEDVLRIDALLPPMFFTPIVVSIIRRSTWEANLQYLDIKEEDEQFSKLDTFYPQIVVLAHAMVGKPAYYIGEPCAVMGEGKQAWAGHGLSAWTIFLYDMLNLFEKLGADRRLIKEGRYNILMMNQKLLLPFLSSESPHLGKKYFSKHKFIWNNRQHPGMLSRLVFKVWLMPGIRNFSKKLSMLGFLWVPLKKIRQFIP